jgi:hypothetical protein
MNKNRKIVLILLAIVLVVVIIATTIDDGKHGNKLTMSYLTENQNSSRTFSVHLELENSGSMKGFMLRNKNVEYNNLVFIKNVKDIVSNLENDTNVSLTWKCGNRNGCDYNSLDQQGLENGTIFSGGTSLLQNYIKNLSENANDSVVTMFISDMVFSVNNANDINKVKAEVANNLCPDVRNALQKAKSNKIELLMLQYTSDFNGDYYYNYQDPQPVYRNQKVTLEKRPFYVLVLGTEQNLNYLVSEKRFPKCEKMWATYAFNNYASQELKTFPDHHWLNNDPNADDNEPVFTFWTQNDWDNQSSEVEIELPKAITYPKFLEDWQPIYESNAVSSVTKISPTRIKVTVKNFDQLAIVEKVNIKLISHRSDWSKCSIDNDVLPLDSVRLLEGKTWGFSYLMETIEEIYPTIKEDVKVGEFNFMFMKQ